jgi:hypothetical protein
MGQTYVRPASASKVGDMSFHLDEKNPYVDFSTTDADKVFANGTHPGKIYFTQWNYEKKDRMFSGRISFDKGGGSYKDENSEF